MMAVTDRCFPSTSYKRCVLKPFLGGVVSGLTSAPPAVGGILRPPNASTFGIALMLVLFLLPAGISFADGGAPPGVIVPPPPPPICDQASLSNIQQGVYPLAAMAAVFMSVIIGLSFMLGNLIHNPKLTLWAKTEVVQLFISIVSVAVIFQGVGVFCSINMVDVHDLFGLGTLTTGQATFSIYSAAEGYLVDSGTYIHVVLNSARYHLGAYNLLETFSRYLCMGDESGAISGFMNIIFCLFGNFLSIGGGTGTSVSPDSGHALAAPALTVAFNSLQFSFLSSLNFLFILKYIYSGFVLFFLPLGIFLRSVPYLRTLGSLLISVAFCFLTVYPTVLAVFYLDLIAVPSVLKAASPALLFGNEDVGSKVDLGNMFSSSIYGAVFTVGSNAPLDTSNMLGIPVASILGGLSGSPMGIGVGDQSFDVIKLAGNCFLMGVFIPSLALLSAAASVAYVNRFLGEEIDLSRIVQMV